MNSIDPNQSPNAGGPNSTSQNHVILLHLTDEQFRWLENTAAFITNETGCAVSHSSIMMRLMAGGLAAFELEMAALRAKPNSNHKRFHNLQLVYTRLDA